MKAKSFDELVEGEKEGYKKGYEAALERVKDFINTVEEFVIKPNHRSQNLLTGEISGVKYVNKREIDEFIEKEKP